MPTKIPEPSRTAISQMTERLWEGVRGIRRSGPQRVFGGLPVCRRLTVRGLAVQVAESVYWTTAGTSPPYWPEIAIRARACYEAASPALATLLREDFVQAASSTTSTRASRICAFRSAIGR